MAQTGYVPISLYYSTTAATAPTAANLVSGELAINITDGILFYKDNAGVVQTLATKAATSGSYTSITLTGGTANGVPYLNASKVLTTGTALTFDGTEFKVNAASGNVLVQPSNVASAKLYMRHGSIGNNNGFEVDVSSNTIFLQAGSEAMRLTSTGLGIGTSSPAAKLDVNGVILMPNNVAFKFKDSGGTARNTFYLDSSNHLNIQNNVNNGNITQTLYGTGVYIWSNSSTELMRLNSSGNLGIGTSSPAAKLDVNGITQSRGNIYGGVANTISNIIAYSNVANGGAGFSQFLFGNTSNDARGYLSYTHASDSILFGTAGTTRATLDSSGNLGLGVTPSAWSLGKAIEVGMLGHGVWQVNTGNTYLVSNVYYASSAYRYAATGYASAYEQSTGGHNWRVAASGTAGNAITFTQAMTLAASGNLMIGTTTESGSGRLRVVNAIRVADSSTETNALLTTVTATTATIETRYGTPIIFGINAAEQMRIDASGNVQVGTAAIATNATNGFFYIPTCAGAPTGTPTAKTGLVPMVYDSTNNNFYIYNGAWKKVALA